MDLCLCICMFLVGEGLVFLLFVCFVLFQFLFYLILFLFLRYRKGMVPDGRGRGGRNWEELRELETEYILWKKNLFFTKEKKETVVKTLSEISVKSGRHQVKIKDPETAVARRIGRDLSRAICR